MFALLDGALRALVGSIEVKEYKGVPEPFDKDLMMDSFDEMSDQPSDWKV